MSSEIKLFKNTSKEQWNKWVEQIRESGLQHSWSYLDYFCKFPGISENLSFAYLNEDGTVAAICPMGITFNREGKYNEVSFGGIPCAVPALAETDGGERRKKLDDIFKIIYDLAGRYEAKKIKMINQPLTLFFADNGFKGRCDFELLRYNFYYHVNNSAIADLNLSEDALFENISKYQRRHIQRGKKKGLKIKVFNKHDNQGELENYFGQFQKAHFLSAGRLTRPQETWDSMLEGAKNGDASLFVLFLNNKPTSFLYCGEFGRMAAGWSQVNLEQYEKEFSPRHLLEWEAILYYKNRGFKYYEIGDLLYGFQLFYLPTKKEKSITIFKERYGAGLMFKIYWTAYLEEQLMKIELNNHWQQFNQGAEIFKLPEN